MILVDTSVWINHLRRSEPTLVMVLEAGHVMMHPFVVGELACGNLNKRSGLLTLLRDLPAAPVATDAEALGIIDRYRLMGLGIDYLGVHLLASVMLAHGARLWTRDKRLAAVSERLNLKFHPKVH
jgi:predicted nucleic acid-binding protein